MPPFQRGHPKIPGSGKKKGQVSYVTQAKEFLEEEGWDGVFDQARKLNQQYVPFKEKVLALEAIKFIAAYAYGKPKQQIGVTGSVDIRAAFLAIIGAAPAENTTLANPCINADPGTGTPAIPGPSAIAATAADIGGSCPAVPTPDIRRPEDVGAQNIRP